MPHSNCCRNRSRHPKQMPRLCKWSKHEEAVTHDSTHLGVRLTPPSWLDSVKQDQTRQRDTMCLMRGRGGVKRLAKKGARMPTLFGFVIGLTEDTVHPSRKFNRLRRLNLRRKEPRCDRLYQTLLSGERISKKKKTKARRDKMQIRHGTRGGISRVSFKFP